jgi:hypothetical protein
MRRFRSRHRIFPALLTLFALAAVPRSFAQMPAPVSGVVTNPAGQPLDGVSVFSGTGTRPYATTTGTDGRFQLANSTTVLHAELDGYQPLTLLINPPADDLRIQLRPIALAPLSGTILAPSCAPIPPNERDIQRLGAGQLGLQFDVPRKGWDLRDLGQGDLHEYVLAPRHSRDQLTLWFGASAIRPTPEDHFFLESSSFAQRAVVVAGTDGPPRSIGIDSYGTFPDGTLWRHLATPGSGATYDHATPHDAALFDMIIASLCVSPTA